METKYSTYAKIMRLRELLDDLEYNHQDLWSGAYLSELGVQYHTRYESDKRHNRVPPYGTLDTVTTIVIIVVGVCVGALGGYLAAWLPLW